MLDFTTGFAPEYVEQVKLERERDADNSRWHRQLHEANVPHGPMPHRPTIIRWPFGPSKDERRRQRFACALDAAQREGITIDAWYGYRFMDPELSARAEWAGLNEDPKRHRHAA